MATTVTQLINDCRPILQDPSPGVTWTDADFLRMANQFELWACMLRPELYTTHGAISLIAGSLQSLPASGTAIMRVDRNTVSKRRVTLVDAAMVDANAYTWAAATEELDVQNWMQDPRDRKRFEVLPPNNGSGSVIALYGAVPPALASVGTNMNLDDIYRMVAVYFMVGEAYSMNTQRQDLTKWTAYNTAAAKLLGVNAQSTLAVLPKLGNQGGA